MASNKAISRSVSTTSRANLPHVADVARVSTLDLGESLGVEIRVMEEEQSFAAD